MKVFLKILLSVLIVLVLLIGGGAIYITWGLNSGSEMVINEVNVSSLSDGTYNGKYNAGRFSNEMNVTIKDHKIIKIDLVKDASLSKDEVTKELLSRVIEKQNTKVDVVAGATVTSKAYLKSIENALKK